MITKIPKSSVRRMKVIYNSGKKSMDALQKELGCQYLINTTLFNMSNFSPAGYLTVDGKVLCTKANPYGFAVKGKSIVFSYGNNVKYPDFTGCYHVLIRDGKVAITQSESAKYGYTHRSAIGLTADGDVVLLCDVTNRSLYGIAGDLLEKGCVTALNFDGGGSSQCITPNSIIRSTRIVLAYLAIWTEDEEEKPDDVEDKPAGDKKIVCIDPGHSASESNGSPDGTYKEHEFALDIGNRIKAILERHNVTVVMTRTDGKYVGLTERANISNRADADLFVSLHSNAAGSGWDNPAGYEVHICGRGGTAEKLAERVIYYMNAIVATIDRGVKVSPNLTVLKCTSSPAVLIEHGFHTNQMEVENLKDMEFRDRYAEADARAILDILGIKYIPGTPWYEPEMEWAKENEIMDGTRPNDPATRAEVVAMIRQSIKLK